MGRAIGAIIIGVLLIIFGASGQFVLKGTNSSIALVVFGIISTIAGIVIAIGNNNKNKKTQEISSSEINNILEQGNTLLIPVLKIWDNISGKTYNLYISENSIIVDKSLKEAEVRYNKYLPKDILGLSKKNYLINRDNLEKAQINMKKNHISIVSNEGKIKGSFQQANSEEVYNALKTVIGEKVEML